MKKADGPGFAHPMLRRRWARLRPTRKEQDVPLTVERLAAELHMDAAEFCRLAREKGREGWRVLLRDAYEQANASVVEYAMKRGSSANMHMLYLKQYAGYRDGEAPAGEPVLFVGEEEV